MQAQTAHKLADRIDGWLATKQASKPEAELMRKLTGLLSGALDAAIIQMRDRGVFGAADIPIIDGIISGLTPDMVAEVMLVNEQFMDPENRYAAGHLLDRAFTASERTIGRMRGDVKLNLERSFIDGVGIQEAARRLKKEFRGLNERELRRIARTETHNAQMAERNRTHEDSSIILAHEWITAIDGRQRDSHGAINGQIVRVGGTFSNGLKFPGDTSGPLSEWINCRCRLAPFFPRRGFMLPPGDGPWRSGDMLLIKGELDLGGLERNYNDPDELLFDLYSRRPIPTSQQTLSVLRQRFPARVWRQDDFQSFIDTPPPIGEPLMLKEIKLTTPAMAASVVTETSLLSAFRNQSRIGGDTANETLYWEGDEINIIQKPISGEALFIKNELNLKRSETLAARERASYLVDNALGFGNVPVTIIRELDGEESMVQQWIDGAKIGQDELDLGIYFKNAENNTLEQIHILDYLTLNLDRHGGNFIIKDGQIYAIDNGYAFPSIFTPKVIPNQLFVNQIVDSLNLDISREDYFELFEDGLAKSTKEAIRNIDLDDLIPKLREAGLSYAAISMFEKRYQNLLQNMDDPDWFFDSTILMDINSEGNAL